jgi:hypothetical protein
MSTCSNESNKVMPMPMPIPTDSVTPIPTPIPIPTESVIPITNKITRYTKFNNCNTSYSKLAYIVSCCNLHYMFPCDTSGYLWWNGNNYPCCDDNCNLCCPPCLCCYCCCCSCLTIYSQKCISYFDANLNKT